MNVLVVRLARPRSLYVVSLLLVSSLASAQKDVKGSADHPLFPSRMPGYTISNYQEEGFSTYKFQMRPPQDVEGKYTKINYYITDPKQHPGALAIKRNYENAIKAVGGEVLYSNDKLSIMKAMRGDVEVWAELRASTGRYYFLNIIERLPMQQVITADAMADAIDKDGFIALDIHFATSRAEVLPESTPAIDEIVALLKKRATLRIGVEGHTDNTGTAEGNKSLSEARAAAVVAAIVAAGIDAKRVEAVGYGQERPVADNRTDEGRAKNRRVEIVKR